MQQVGLFWRLEGLSNEVLIGGLERLIGSGRRVLAQLLAHLSEVEERRLHLDAGYPSMFVYCTARLGLTEDEAYRRIEVARLARRTPLIFEGIASGALTLSVVVLLKPHASAPNFGELLQTVSGLSVQRAREALAACFPKPDVPASIRKQPERQALPLLAPPDQPQQPPAPKPAPVRAPDPTTRASQPLVPLAPDRFKLQLTADAAFKAKLELARDLSRHAIPTGDFTALLGRALDLLIAEQMKRRFGKLPRGQKAKPRPSKKGAEPEPSPPEPASPEPLAREQPLREPTTTHVERRIRRALLERDGLRCTFRSEDGVRCDARAWLERDHVLARARGGPTSVENLRHLCRSHNRRAAELAFGRAQVERAIRARRRSTSPITSP